MDIDDNKVCFGMKSIQFAYSNKAIKHLLVSDKLFRSSDF